MIWYDMRRGDERLRWRRDVLCRVVLTSLFLFDLLQNSEEHIIILMTASQSINSASVLAVIMTSIPYRNARWACRTSSDVIAIRRASGLAICIGCITWSVHITRIQRRPRESEWRWTTRPPQGSALSSSTWHQTRRALEAAGIAGNVMRLTISWSNRICPLLNSRRAYTHVQRRHLRIRLMPRQPLSFWTQVV